MTALILFAVLAVVYIVFLIWYYGPRKPLSKEEVDQYVSIQGAWPLVILLHGSLGNDHVPW